MSNGNFSFDEILRMANASGGKKPDEVVDSIKNRLPDEKKEALSKLLSDRNAMEQLLKSEQAQKLMERLRGGNKSDG